MSLLAVENGITPATQSSPIGKRTTFVYCLQVHLPKRKSLQLAHSLTRISLDRHPEPEMYKPHGHKGRSLRVLFVKRVRRLQGKGLDSTNRVFISDRAHVVFDLHQMVDGIEETALAKSIGAAGIGPTHSTKAANASILVVELFDQGIFERRLRKLARLYKAKYGELLQFDVEEI
jgi:hypothetical protein